MLRDFEDFVPGSEIYAHFPAFLLRHVFIGIHLIDTTLSRSLKKGSTHSLAKCATTNLGGIIECFREESWSEEPGGINREEWHFHRSLIVVLSFPTSLTIDDTA